LLDSLNTQPRIFSPAGGGQGFGDRTSISFHLGQDSEITIKIYNVAGRLKKVLAENQSFLAGKHAMEWDGKDDDGQYCVSGLHIVSIVARGKVETKTVLVLNKY
jgi:flagellar hook assembly protein FlgD